jgi:hypothetical protein
MVANGENATDSQIAGWEADIDARVAKLYSLTATEVKL